MSINYHSLAVTLGLYCSIALLMFDSFCAQNVDFWGYPLAWLCFIFVVLAQLLWLPMAHTYIKWKLGTKAFIWYHISISTGITGHTGSNYFWFCQKICHFWTFYPIFHSHVTFDLKGHLTIKTALPENIYIET